MRYIMSKVKENYLKKIERKIKKGYGQGLGEAYKPWHEVKDVPSIGSSTKAAGYKIARIHHLLSQLEKKYFYTLEWSPVVTDVREQYPLLPIQETLQIAERIGVKHPMNIKEKEPEVMTTDFLINFGDTIVARTVKYSKDTNSQRIMEKLEIERLYWKSRNVDWGIITEIQISEILVDNIMYIYKSQDIDDIHTSIQNKFEGLMLDELLNNVPISDAANIVDDRLGLSPGTALSLTRHFLATRRWIVDMSIPINPHKPLKVLNANSSVITTRLGG